MVRWRERRRLQAEAERMLSGGSILWIAALLAEPVVQRQREAKADPAEGAQSEAGTGV